MGIKVYQKSVSFSLSLFSSNLQFLDSYFHKAGSKVVSGFVLTMKVTSSPSEKV